MNSMRAAPTCALCCLLLGVFAGACRADLPGVGAATATPNDAEPYIDGSRAPAPPSAATSDLGWVRAEARSLDGEPVAGAQFTVGSVTAQTDADGLATLAISAGDWTWSASSAAHAPLGGSVAVRADGTTPVAIWLQSAQTTTIRSDAPVLETGSLDIDFSDASFRSADGQLVDEVAASWVVVDDPARFIALPEPSDGIEVDGASDALTPIVGLELSLTTGGQPVSMEGQAAIRLEGLATAPLLQGLTTAPLGILGPVLEGLTTAPLGLALVHYDPELGRWLPEGELDLDDDVLVAEVSHFSWWAVALRSDLRTCAHGRVHDANGAPISQAEVVVSQPGTLGWSRAWTDAEGRYCANLPAGASVSIDVRHGDAVAQGSATVTAADAACGAACDPLGTLVVEAGADAVDADGDGATTAGPDVPPGAVDCDDSDPERFPGQVERCNGIDDNCSGTVDDGAVDAPQWWSDADGDGVGAESVTWACAMPANTSDVDGDCDDTRRDIHPGAAEVCDDVDQDCDGVVDDDAVDGQWFWPDLDGDGQGDSGSDPTWTCLAPADSAAAAGDCDDTQATTHSGAEEVCDGVDNDCDGQADNDPVDGIQTWPDADGDTWGDDNASATLTCPDTPATATRTGDCDDQDAAVHSGALVFDAGAYRSPCVPMGSCADYLAHASYGGEGDGRYWIDPDGPAGDEFAVYCDMTIDGGGWTLSLDQSADDNTPNLNLDGSDGFIHDGLVDAASEVMTYFASESATYSPIDARYAFDKPSDFHLWDVEAADASPEIRNLTTGEATNDAVLYYGSADFIDDACSAWTPITEVPAWGRFAACLDAVAGTAFDTFPFLNGQTIATEEDFCSAARARWDQARCTSSRFVVLFVR